MIRGWTAFIWACSLFIFPPPLSGQESQWQNLSQIRSGTNVQVVEQSLKSTSGAFVRFSEADLTLRVDGRDVLIPKAHVFRVTLPRRNRKRNALIGLGAGAGLGLAFGVGALEREGNFAGAVAGSTAGFAGVGALIGALVPSGKTIYRVKRARSAP